MRTALVAVSAAILASFATYSATAGHERAHLAMLLGQIDSALQHGRFDAATLDATEQDLGRVLRRLNRGGTGRPGAGFSGDFLAIGQACDSAFSGDAYEDRCLRAMQRVSFDPRPAIHACEQAMNGDDSELACVEVASRSRVEPAAAINACEAAFSGDELELRCMSAATALRHGAAGVIRECEDAFSGDEAELQCIALAPPLGRRAAEAVRYCEEQKSGDDAELACLRALGTR